MRKSHCDSLTITNKNNIIYTNRILKIGWDAMVGEKRIRFHKRSGVIHNILDCCSAGKPQNDECADNFQECTTYLEAETILNYRHKKPQRCKRCKWPKEKGGTI